MNGHALYSLFTTHTIIFVHSFFFFFLFLFCMCATIRLPFDLFITACGHVILFWHVYCIGRSEISYDERQDLTSEN